MKTKILGINCLGSYDVSAALIIDGEIVAAVEEERLNRVRHTSNFPKKSIDFCLQKANLSINDIDVIAVSGIPKQYIFEFFIPLATQYPDSNTFSRNLHMAAKHSNIENEIRKQTNYQGPIRFHLHHFTHWASVFYTNNVTESAILSVDGVGESQTVLGGAANENGFDTHIEVKWPNSLGVLYNGISYWCGFNYKDAGKTMALASFGEHSEFENIFKKLINLNNDGTFELNSEFISFGYERDTWFKGEFREVIGQPRQPGAEITHREKNLAYALQESFEYTMLHMLNYLYDKTKLDTISIVGGCVYNCVTNGNILDRTNFKHLLVQPAAGDAGTSIGAALYDYNKFFELKQKVVQTDTYLGPEFSNDEIESQIKKAGQEFENLTNPSETAAGLLENGKIIGWFQGRMEFGPRALGNRSILAPPYPASIKDQVNRDVKHREIFRPFAPAVLEEKYNDYFEKCANSKYMLVNTFIKPESLSKIPAVSHVDHTARVQTVSETSNARFYNLIKYFGEKTGIPVVLNTSFNDKNMPIVCTPNDAIECFLNTDMSYLVIGNYLLRK